MFLVGVLLLAGRLPAQVKPDPLPADLPDLTSVQAFWSLSPEEALKKHRLRFDLLIYYYDPSWQLLSAECDGRGIYLPTHGEALPIKAGQRVRLEGEVLPARHIMNRDMTVTLLEEKGLPSPITTAGILADSNRLESQWASVEGFVCQQREVDANHIEYVLLADGWLVVARVLVGGKEAVPQLLFSRARFNGVYVGKKDVDQQLHHIEFWVPSPREVTFLGNFEDDERFKLPPTAIDQLDHAEKTGLVRLVGTVQAFNSGHSLTIRDTTGQLVVPTVQPATLKEGDSVEVVGRVTGAGLNQTLAEPLIHRLAEELAGGESTVGARGPSLRLRVVEQIRELSLKEVASGYAVTIRGVVTWADPRGDFFYAQDVTGGGCVWRPKNLQSPVVGEAIVIQGKTIPGRYAPEIGLEEFTVSPAMVQPPARTITLEQAMLGEDEARLVQISGFLRQVAREGNWTRLDITTVSGEFSAYAPADDFFATLRGAIVQVAGVCSVTADNQREMTGLRLLLSGRESVVVEQAPLADRFLAPRMEVAGLKRLSGVGKNNRQVIVSGVVTGQLLGRSVVIQSEGAGLVVFGRAFPPMTLGSAIEVVGLPGREGRRVVLREAISRPAAVGTKVLPFELMSVAQPWPEFDCRLVRLRAVISQSVPQNGAIRLTLQADGAIFDAVVIQPGDWAVPESGSRLELTGVYLVEFDANRRPRGFRLELQTPGEVHVLETPSWWTSGRAFAVAGGLAVCTLLGLVWVTVLRRRVKQQTEKIRLQADKERHLQTELERATRLDSIGVLAGGIAHDFNNLLTAIRGNLGLIQLDPKAMELVGGEVEDAERAAKRATEVAQQLLTFAKGGDPLRALVELPALIRESADSVLKGSKVRGEFDLAEGLPPADVDAGQIRRVVHNLVTNAVEAMTGGGVVRLTLSAVVLEIGEVSSLAAGNYLLLVIADNGPGIPGERLPRIFDPFFSTKASGSGLGLATCHSIVKKHRGQIEVISAPAAGTTFRIWLPAAIRPGAVEKLPTAPAQMGAGARVLLMDDDEVVRDLARAFFGRARHDGVIVRDGAEALAVYQRALAEGNPYDLVIFDLTVPGGMGGVEALAALRKVHPAVRAVASSGYASDPVMSNHRAFGFFAVLPKPYGLDAFTRVIDLARRAPR